MAFTVRLLDRGGSDIGPTQLEFKPKRWAGTVRGGFTDATIDVKGKSDHMETLKDSLGFRVTILNEHGHPVWWGYIHEVQIRKGSTTATLSLDRMHNRVKVKHSYEAGDGAHEEETAWYDDSWSQTIFGIKETIEEADDTRPADAIKKAQQILSKRKLPSPVASPGSAETEPSATLTCRGRFDLLDWRFYAQPKGYIIHSPSSDASAILGWGFQGHIGFGRGDRTIHQIDCQLIGPRKGDKLKITGSYVPFPGGEDNDGIWTVEEEASQERVVTYTADTITFDPTDDIFDLDGGGLAVFSVGEMIQVTGTGGANDKFHMLDTATMTQLATWTGWNGVIFSWSSGLPVTIKQGCHITVEEEDLYKAIPGAGGSNPIIKVTTQQLAQRVLIPETGSWKVGEIAIYASRIGSPSDNLALGLYADSSGTIGSLLQEVEFTGLDIQENEMRVAFDFGGTTTVTAGTYYWLKLMRTGTYHHLDYYEVSLTESELMASLLEYDDTTYTSRIPLAAMLYEIIGVQETTSQIADMVAAGTQLAGVTVDADHVGPLKPLYRSGDHTVMEEVLDLLEFGFADGHYLFAEVNEKDILRLYHPLSYDPAQSIIWRDGKMIGQSNAVLPPGVLPFGQWMILADFPVMANQASSFSPVLLDTVEYDASADQYDWQPVGAEDRIE